MRDEMNLYWFEISNWCETSFVLISVAFHNYSIFVWIIVGISFCVVFTGYFILGEMKYFQFDV